MQLANLGPETAEEAKALIPRCAKACNARSSHFLRSLENKIDDDELDELLKELRTKKTFQ